ncbi:MAG: Cation/multidrug efflux pump [uncultured Thiotrichaceae bacterium]|uniref:Cation/multidrug efflux pump n=1 Tax=uncultured Thiotrichaceae bacterium TaxID=298394 RepID=A0A6S6U787_9GAMM|nr:MAG: Cation/multidrug efflux pump [uncultured Thiotrichaceae bacterium]
MKQSELKALAEDYRNRLLAMPQVKIVEVTGFSTHEYSVLIRPEVLQQYKLSVSDIASLIKAQALDLPAGEVETDERAYQIRFENARRTPEALADLVILNSDQGGQLRLGDIATIRNKFSDVAQRTEINGKPAATILISKNKTDDTLKVYDAVKAFVDEENERLPDSTHLYITQESATIVRDRLTMLLKNGWQGLLLAVGVLFLFFTWRYTFWVAMGLPISFLGGLVIMSIAGISINMISMVALLMAIGILMDDAIVLAESIETEYRKGKTPVQAATDGVSRVARGVFSSFITSVFLFGSLLFMKGDMGQILGVIPVVLLAVLSVSLLEAFLILPHHLKHSLEKRRDAGGRSALRLWLDKSFMLLTEGVGKLADLAIKLRYMVVGGTIALLIFSISMLASGALPFKGFPDTEGNQVEARILLPQGTRLSRTEEVVQTLLDSLDLALAEMKPEDNGELVRIKQVTYSENGDASESGEHLATIGLELLSAELRNNSLHDLMRKWREHTPVIPDALSILLKEPGFGPGGQAVSIRLQGLDLDTLSRASWDLQHWLSGYTGISNILDDLRPGKPQFIIKLRPGALNSGMDAQYLSNQLRSAYQGVKVSDVYLGREAYEINVQLDSDPQQALQDFEQLTVLSKQGVAMPLTAIAEIKETREFARIVRINHQQTVTVGADVDSAVANAGQIIADVQKRFFPELEERYPGLMVGLEGETQNSAETSQSVLVGFVLGIAGVYLLLSLQFSNYREPLIVLMNIPMALIGVIWGHILMGLSMSLPSMIGFVALAGVVVNDSILLVEFVKMRSAEGMNLHEAAGQAVRDRFRAVFLTSITTIAGILPLLAETSTQAQVLIPLVTSIGFGMLTSTVLILMVLPAGYAILEDFGFTELPEVESEDEEIEAAAKLA